MSDACDVTLHECISTPGKPEKYAWPRRESEPTTFEFRGQCRHIFQTYPVWIYTQSKHHIHLSTLHQHRKDHYHVLYIEVET
jgi:hypothetical protein